MNQYGESPWSEERVALLRKLWAEGFSASQCAAKLGKWATRSAVCAKINRIGLSGRGQQRLTSSKARRMKAASAMAKPRREPKERPQPHHVRRATVQLGKPVAKPNLCDGSPASLAAMALLGAARASERRCEGFRARP